MVAGAGGRGWGRGVEGWRSSLATERMIPASLLLLGSLVNGSVRALRPT